MKPEPIMLTPSAPSVKRMGLAPSGNNNNRDSGAEPRMDLDENNDRLTAQVKWKHLKILCFGYNADD